MKSSFFARETAYTDGNITFLPRSDGNASAFINLNIWLHCKVGQSSSVKEGFVRDTGNCIFSFLSNLCGSKIRAAVPSVGAGRWWLSPEGVNIPLQWN